jgi:saccharopine dehydrogenase-like NADP-dependent oxidoreductase
VSTNYSEPASPLHHRAKTTGSALIPECGLDPGIDLVLCGHAVSQFDEVHLFNSFCGGFPEKEACNNPINYKISWNWDLVLGSQMRDSVIIRDGNRIEIDGANQHDHEFLGTIDFPGLGMLESIPNGKVDAFTDLLGISDTVRSAGRYLLRWPGWSDFWRPLKALGFLSDKPLKNLSEQISPRQVVSKIMEPALHYAEGEKDIVAMYNEFQGVKEGRKKKIISKLLIKRDLESGFFAMNMGVGCPASIVAQMIAGGVITKKGVLSPAIDIPYAPFMLELANRGILIDEKITRDMA